MPIRVIKGDITQQHVDAIVNAANQSLLGGGGVDGAIHRIGGPEILKECKIIGGCKTGKAVVTNAGNLHAKKVIHTVGPIWHGGIRKEKELLGQAYSNSMKIAEALELKTIAFPNISTGAYGFPKIPAAEIAIRTIKDFIVKSPLVFEIIFVCFDDENFNIYQQLLSS